MKTAPNAFALACLALTATALIWSGFAPKDRATWLMEIAPILIAIPIILATWKRFPLSALLVGVITLHAIVLMVGGKYTYAEVPLFDWVRDTFQQSRNNYDKVGHFMQGFGPALVARELLLRTSPLRQGKWLFVLVVLACLDISAIYELIEWGAAIAMGQGADQFLGTQGDPWDTQKDMAFAGIGAVVGMLLFAKSHDRSIARLPH
jgi:putative membrane protein